MQIGSNDMQKGLRELGVGRMGNEVLNFKFH